jgi:type I restriction enzyme S subunit
LILDPAFLFYYLGLPRVTAWISNQAIGATLPNLNTAILRSVPIAYPSLPVQKSIASILSAYDNLIDNNTRRIKILEEMAQAIYREWFVHFRFPGHKKVKLVNSPIGPIPEGWKVGQISDVASIFRDSVYPADYEGETFEHFSIPAYDQGRLPTLDLGETIKSNKHVIAESCVLLSKLNPRIPRVWLPILSGSHRAVASTEFLVLAAGSQSSREFVYCLCASSEFLGAFAGRALGTSTSHQRVKPDDFLSMEIFVPGRPITLEFSELVAPILSSANTLRLKNQNLRQTRDLLLPKLVSGEVDVSDLDINVGDAAA